MKRISLAVAVLVLSSCQGDEECKSFAASNDGTAEWGQCGDKKTRQVKCQGVVRGAPPTGQPTPCTCSVDGVAGKSFQLNDVAALRSKESMNQLANFQCGWQLK